MTVPQEPPRWRALEIGPGGLAADRVRATGPGAPMEHAAAQRAAVAELPALWQTWAAQSAPTAPAPHRGLARPVATRIGVGLVALLLVVGLALWAKTSHPRGNATAAQIPVGDCLSSVGQRISGRVSCQSADADFAVVGNYPDTSDASACSASPSDVAVVAGGPRVLCLDYVAVVGDCLFAGATATQVGKIDCSSTLPGVYRVKAVLQNSINPADCPDATTQTLVHRHNSQVICLGRV